MFCLNKPNEAQSQINITKGGFLTARMNMNVYSRQKNTDLALN